MQAGVAVHMVNAQPNNWGQLTVCHPGRCRGNFHKGAVDVCIHPEAKASGEARDIIIIYSDESGRVLTG